MLICFNLKNWIIIMRIYGALGSGFTSLLDLIPVLVFMRMSAGQILTSGTKVLESMQII